MLSKTLIGGTILAAMADPSFTSVANNLMATTESGLIGRGIWIFGFSLLLIGRLSATAKLK
jgi:hypothetical protein